MYSKPKIFNLLPAVFLLIVAAFPLQIMWLYGHGSDEWSGILSKLTLFNWGVMAGLVINAVMVFRVSPLLRYSLPALVAVIALNNFMVGLLATDYPQWMANLATLGFVGLCGPLILPRTRHLIVNPSMHWWRVAERKSAHLEYELSGVRNIDLKGQTFDISMSGMFIPLTQRLAILTPNQTFTIELVLDENTRIQCEGRIVRQTEAKGRYPAGVGIRFTDMPSRSRNELKRYLARH